MHPRASGTGDHADGLWTTRRPDDPRQGPLDRLLRVSQASFALPTILALEPNPPAEFFDSFSDEIKIAIHIQIGIQHARWSVGSGTERGPTSRLLRNERKKTQAGSSRNERWVVSGSPSQPGVSPRAGHKPAARSPEVPRRRWDDHRARTSLAAHAGGLRGITAA